MNEKIFNVLFLCTGNSSRSIMVEAMINTMCNARFSTWSADSYPCGAVNPFAVEEVGSAACPATNLRSKSWKKYAAPDAAR